jgi:hypothetical protein
MVGGRTPAKGDDRKPKPVAKSTPAKVDDRKSKAVAKMKLKIPPVATSPSFDSGWDYSKPNEATSASLESGNPSGAEEDGKPEAVDKRGVKKAPKTVAKSPAVGKKTNQTEVLTGLYGKSPGVPEWMSYLTVDKFRKCNIFGEETHIRCALYLTIKRSFSYLFENKENEWAKLTLAGLNKVMKFHELLVVGGTEAKSISEMCDKWPLKMEDLKPPPGESFVDLSVEIRKTQCKDRVESVRIGFEKNKGKKKQSQYRLSHEMPDVEEANKHFRETHFPIWMEAINETNLQSYSELGYVNHVKCALFLIIKHCFQHIYPNRYRLWAGLTVKGLNQIMNFYETLSEQPGPNNDAPGDQDERCPWREVGWLKM